MRRSAAISPRPVLDEVIEAHGGDRADWEWICDRASMFRHDDAVLHVLESEAQRDELNRKLGVEYIGVARARGRSPLSRRFGGGSLPLASKFRGLFIDGGTSATRDSWFDADRYTPVSTKVGDFLDYIDASHTITQGSDANRVGLPTADAAYSNAVTAPFLRASGTRYSSSRAPGDWTFMHSGAGAGADVFVVATPKQNTGTGVWLTTRTSLTGATLYRTSPNGRGYYVGNAGSAAINSATGSLTIDVATYREESFATADTPDFTTFLKSATVASGNATSPASGDPQQTLMLGSDGSNHESMNWRAMYIFRRSLTAAARVVVRSWIQSQTGLTP